MKIQTEKHLINPKESQAYKIVPLIFVSKVTEELVCLSIFSRLLPFQAFSLKID